MYTITLILLILLLALQIIPCQYVQITLSHNACITGIMPICSIPLMIAAIDAFSINSSICPCISEDANYSAQKRKIPAQG